MSTGEAVGPVLDEETLAREWRLSPEDVTLVMKCCGVANRLRFALQLCTLRANASFLDDPGDAPLAVLTHLAVQLGLPPTLFLAPAERASTGSAFRQRIREYLGFRSFDDEARAELGAVLEGAVVRGAGPEELRAQAEGWFP